MKLDIIGLEHCNAAVYDLNSIFNSGYDIVFLDTTRDNFIDSSDYQTKFFQKCLELSVSQDSFLVPLRDARHENNLQKYGIDSLISEYISCWYGSGVVLKTMVTLDSLGWAEISAVSIISPERRSLFELITKSLSNEDNFGPLKHLKVDSVYESWNGPVSEFLESVDCVYNAYEGDDLSILDSDWVSNMLSKIRKSTRVYDSLEQPLLEVYGTNPFLLRRMRNAFKKYDLAIKQKRIIDTSNVNNQFITSLLDEHMNTSAQWLMSPEFTEYHPDLITYLKKNNKNI